MNLFIRIPAGRSPAQHWSVEPHCDTVGHKLYGTSVGSSWAVGGGVQSVLSSGSNSLYAVMQSVPRYYCDVSHSTVSDRHDVSHWQHGQRPA
ncbi:hypothetical protein BaRGS_00009926 [Batillaria attramentaria]|uniref:Uncharacterized protein n=1 Tax=Batillaria attramentaria TaxID=370345 RepID=A0ABD0LIM4_9CAEN